MLERGYSTGVITPIQIDEFTEAKNRWYFDTLDSTASPSDNPDFRKIVKMGPVAVPLILEELKVNPSLLFVALELITGENPVQETGAESLEDINEAWQRWAEENKRSKPLVRRTIFE